MEIDAKYIIDNKLRDLYYLLIGIDANNLLLDDVYSSIRKSDLANIRIPLPSKEKQQKIITKIDEEKKIIVKHKKQLQTAQAKMKNKLKHMWKDDDKIADKFIFDALISKASKFIFYGVPNGNRTRVVAVKEQCPNSLDDEDKETIYKITLKNLYLQWFEILILYILRSKLCLFQLVLLTIQERLFYI